MVLFERIKKKEKLASNINKKKLKINSGFTNQVEQCPNNLINKELLNDVTQQDVFYRSPNKSSVALSNNANLSIM